MRRVSPQEARELMEREGFAYLDVRTVAEFDTGHPPGAYNVPLSLPAGGGLSENPEFVREVRAVLDPGQPIVVGCESGVRSMRAATLLGESGFERLVEQRAGMAGVRDPFGRVREPGWRAAGLPVEMRGEPARSYREISARVRARSESKP